MCILRHIFTPSVCHGEFCSVMNKIVASQWQSKNKKC